MHHNIQGAFVWDQSGIRIIGIMRVSVCLGSILSGIPGFPFRLFCSQEQNSRNSSSKQRLGHGRSNTERFNSIPFVTGHLFPSCSHSVVMPTTHKDTQTSYYNTTLFDANPHGNDVRPNHKETLHFS